ncbi:hypothetical protein JCM3766R1_003956 [Sporobolomyces carnicolor]
MPASNQDGRSLAALVLPTAIEAHSFDTALARDVYDQILVIFDTFFIEASTLEDLELYHDQFVAQLADIRSRAIGAAHDQGIDRNFATAVWDFNIRREVLGTYAEFFAARAAFFLRSRRQPRR